jgi:hypothetical protein
MTLLKVAPTDSKTVDENTQATYDKAIIEGELTIEGGLTISPISGNAFPQGSFGTFPLTFPPTR